MKTGYVKTSLLLVGLVIAYCLITAILNSETAAGDISGIIFFTVLVFVWRLTTNPNRNYFS